MNAALSKVSNAINKDFKGKDFLNKGQAEEKLNDALVYLTSMELEVDFLEDSQEKSNLLTITKDYRNKYDK